jgi:hypothetical protein
MREKRFYDMSPWTQEQLETIGSTDDFHISPYRADGNTPGTPNWIWSVVVDGNVYVPRWHRSAMTQRAGRIRAGGIETDVSFIPVDGEINDRIDAAYSVKYARSPYLALMISNRTRAATVRVDPR